MLKAARKIKNKQVNEAEQQVNAPVGGRDEFMVRVSTTVGAVFGGQELGSSLSRFVAALSSTAGVVLRTAAWRRP